LTLLSGGALAAGPVLQAWAAASATLDILPDDTAGRGPIPWTSAASSRYRERTGKGPGRCRVETAIRLDLRANPLDRKHRLRSVTTRPDRYFIEHQRASVVEFAVEHCAPYWGDDYSLRFVVYHCQQLSCLEFFAQSTADVNADKKFSVEREEI
jgi:hypothetical protein